MEISIQGDDINEAMKDAPEEVKEFMRNLISKHMNDNPISYIKHWIGLYNESDKVDQLIAKVISPLISKIGAKVHGEINKAPDGTYTGGMAALAAVEVIRKLADTIESTIKEGEAQSH